MMFARVARHFLLPSLMLFCAAASQATVVIYQVVPVTPDDTQLFRYIYTVKDFVFAQNQEFDVQFSPDSYRELANGQAPSGFNVILFQPNDPAYLYGDFTALATADTTSSVNTFSVEFRYLGAGLPGAQQWTINQFDSAHTLVNVVASGSTVPEPAGCAAFGLVFAVWGAYRVRRKA